MVPYGPCVADLPKQPVSCRVENVPAARHRSFPAPPHLHLPARNRRSKSRPPRIALSSLFAVHSRRVLTSRSCDTCAARRGARCRRPTHATDYDVRSPSCETHTPPGLAVLWLIARALAARVASVSIVSRGCRSTQPPRPGRPAASCTPRPRGGQRAPPPLLAVGRRIEVEVEVEVDADRSRWPSRVPSSRRPVVLSSSCALPGVDQQDRERFSPAIFRRPAWRLSFTFRGLRRAGHGA